MSIEAMGWAFRQDIAHPGAKLVLLALCDFADESWSCFPGQATLAEKTSQSERTVRRHLEWLEQHGYIISRARFANGRRTSNRYTIHNPNRSTPLPTPAAAAPTPDKRPATPPPEHPAGTGKIGAIQAGTMTAGQFDHRPVQAEEPVNMTGEPSENHQQNNPPPPSDKNRPPGGGCTAHPNTPGPNCRHCGTNPRARQAAADPAVPQRHPTDRERQETQLWLQAQRHRRGQVAQQEALGALNGPRQAARDAVRRRDRGENPPTTPPNPGPRHVS